MSKNDRPPVVNPYKKDRRPLVPIVDANETMGRQSQQRASNAKRAKQLCQPASFSGKKLKKGDQRTLFGTKAFEAIIDCVVCAAHEARKFRHEVPIPHRPRHNLCDKNKGGGISKEQMASSKEEKYLQALKKVSARSAHPTSTTPQLVRQEQRRGNFKGTDGN